jgi:hypothetical protein
MRWRSACQPKKSRLSCLSALMSIASNPFRYRRASNFERGFLVLAPIPRGPPRLQSHHRHGFARHPFAVYSSHERIEHSRNPVKLAKMPWGNEKAPDRSGAFLK